jgi:hypothetical protein
VSPGSPSNHEALVAWTILVPATNLACHSTDLQDRNLHDPQETKAEDIPKLSMLDPA